MPFPSLKIEHVTKVESVSLFPTEAVLNVTTMDSWNGVAERQKGSVLGVNADLALCEVKHYEHVGKIMYTYRATITSAEDIKKLFKTLENIPPTEEDF